VFWGLQRGDSKEVAIISPPLLLNPQSHYLTNTLFHTVNPMLIPTTWNSIIYSYPFTYSGFTHGGDLLLEIASCYYSTLPCVY